HVVLPAADRFGPDLVLVSAGFDAHRDDPLADCRLETSSFAQMACHTREAAAAWGVPVGAALEGGYDLDALAASAVAALSALAGEGSAASVPLEPALTPNAAAQVSRYWGL